MVSGRKCGPQPKNRIAEETCHEQENVPTQYHQAQADPRLPGPDENPGRSGHHQASSGPGPQATDRLTMRSFALPRNSRLTKTGEFDRVYARGRRLHGPGFSLIYAANALGHNRLGISIRKKTGNAVRRNRIKRIIREAFRLHRDLFPPRSDIVVTVRPGFALDAPAEVVSAVAGLLNRHGAVC